uniref:Protein kinase domain-containing protein n=1 Tax=Salix viminalis TaxID=40686 RepID=A0A6N2L5X9_SALVM
MVGHMRRRRRRHHNDSATSDLSVFLLRSFSIMKCFHFSNGERREDEDAPVSKVSRVSWARSLSVASSSLDTRRSELDSDSYCYSSRDLSDSVGLFELPSQRRANDLRVFGFSELKSATRGFSRGLLIGEGGFGCVYRGVVKVPSDHDSSSKMDVAIKQLNRHGFQACLRCYN